MINIFLKKIVKISIIHAQSARTLLVRKKWIIRKKSKGERLLPNDGSKKFLLADLHILLIRSPDFSGNE